MVCLPASVNLTPAKAQVVKKRLCRDGRLLVWAYAPGLSDGWTLDATRVAIWAGVPFGTDGVSVADAFAPLTAIARLDKLRNEGAPLAVPLFVVDDNFFWLDPGEVKRVKVNLAEGIDRVACWN